MKGVILAGGNGTRLGELTAIFPKSMVPVYNQALIVHVIKQMVLAGVTELAICVNERYFEWVRQTVEIAKVGVAVTWLPGPLTAGPCSTLLRAQDFVGNDEFALMHDDSLYFSRLDFRQSGPHMFVMPMDDGEDFRKYAQVKLDGPLVTHLYIRPSVLHTRYIQTAAFVLPPDAFSRAANVVPNDRGETPIDLLTIQYVEEGVAGYTMLPPRSYLDCGTPDALLEAANRVAGRIEATPRRSRRLIMAIP